MVVKERATPPEREQDMKNYNHNQATNTVRNGEPNGRRQSEANNGSGTEQQNRDKSGARAGSVAATHGDRDWQRATNFWF